MTLLRRVGAGLILMGSLFPAQAEARWPWFGGDCGCSAPPPPMATCGPVCGPAPMMAPAPMIAPAPMAFQPAAPCCGAQPHMGRLPRRHYRNTVTYRSRTRIRMRGHGNWDDSLFGASAMGTPSYGFPSSGCGCGASASTPMILPEQSPMIVPQSSMMTQPIITYQNVPKTVMRQEAIQVQVPTTTYQQVAVDEGSFQQVWVPRMVTKTVPRTVMSTQMQYRQVPQTVYESVPQITATTGTFGSSYALGGTSYPIATPTTVTPTPDFNSSAPINPVPFPPSDTAVNPQTTPQTSQVQEWQKVRQRSATIQQQSYETESREESGYLVPKAAGRFSSSRR